MRRQIVEIASYDPLHLWWSQLLLGPIGTAPDHKFRRRANNARDAKEAILLFLTYWELNEDTPLEQRLQAAQTLMSKGLFPGKDVKIVRWDITPGGWGVTISEAESAIDVARSIDVWRAAVPGFFKTIKVSPAVPVTEGVSALVETLQALKS